MFKLQLYLQSQNFLILGLQQSINVNFFFLFDRNHMGPQENLTPRTKEYVKAYNPFNKTEHFHVFCIIDNFEDQGNVEYCSLGGPYVPLPGM